jgi:predicted component of type VI protein secretion system
MNIQQVSLTSEEYEDLVIKLKNVIHDSFHNLLRMDDFEYEHAKQALSVTGRVVHNVCENIQEELNEIFNSDTSHLISHTIIFQGIISFSKTLQTSGRWNALHKNKEKFITTFITYVETLCGIGDFTPTMLCSFINLIQ